MTLSKPDNIFWINLLRVVSIFSVVMLHSSADIVINITDKSSISWWVGNFFDSATRWSVPVFVMISGVLLLDPQKKESFRQFYEKRANRILLPLLFWTLAYLLILKFFYNIELDFLKVLISVLKGNTYPHLWFIYMLIGLYAFTPYLRRFIQSSSNKDRFFLIIFIFCFACLHTFMDYFFFNNTSRKLQTIFSLFIPYIGYFILGYQLSLIDKCKLPYKIIISLILLPFLIVFVCAGLTTHEFGLAKGLYFYDYLNPAVIILSAGIFLFVNKLLDSPDTPNKLFSSFIEKIAPYSLGIYLMHPMISEIFRFYFEITPRSFNFLIGIPVHSIANFMICIFAISIIIRIPYLRRVVS